MKGKKIIALLLILSMTMVMVACESDSKDSGDTTSDASNSGEETTSDNGEEAEEVEEAEDEEVYTVGIQVVTLPGTEYAGQEDREAAINAIIEPAINCKVDIQEIWINELTQKTSMSIASGEKMDLIHVGTVQRLSSMVGTEMLLDMNEDNMLQNYGQGLIDLFGEEILKSGNVNGQQLAIPSQTFNAIGNGFYYNKTAADEYGVNVPEKISSLDEFTVILEEVKAKIPDMMPFYQGTGELNIPDFISGYTSFGNKSMYGVIMDDQADLTIENLYASDLYKDYALSIFDWTQKGLQPVDPTDSAAEQDYFGAGRLFAIQTGISEHIKVSIQSRTDFEVGWIEMVEPQITNSTVSEYMWGISSNSIRPEKAMEFLNYLYTNADVANILYLGLEGDNYEIKEGTDNIAVINGSYISVFYRGGNTSEMLIKAPAGPDYIELSEAMEAKATISPILGYTFDDGDFQTEASVISTVIAEYIPQINNGAGGSVEGTLELLAEFNEELKASGIDDVIAANQAQLDAYMNGN